jgi:hypothetical protein
MNEKDLNIKSSTIEKGLEIAKDFIDKLIGPSIEQVGLLFSDNIKFFRFKNQVKILVKAKNYVENRNLDTKSIPLKILVPLIEKASLEESEELQDKWAIMITNLADSKKNLQNQIFPYILSQISIEEYQELLELNDREKLHLGIIESYNKLRKEEQGESEYYFHPSEKVKRIQREIQSVEQSGFPVYLENFELSNLERLGLIKSLPPKIEIEEFKTGNYEFTGEVEEWHQLEAKYETDRPYYRISGLGERFIEILELKNENASG